MRWVKLTNQTNVLKQRSFINDLKDLGVVARYVIHKGDNCVTAVKLSHAILEKAFAKYYALDRFCLDDFVLSTGIWVDLAQNRYPPGGCSFI
jgi:hypothetical protein